MWRRPPDGEWLLRGFAVTGAAALLLGYALFLIFGAKVATQFLSIAWAPIAVVFLSLLARYPTYLLATLIFGGLLAAVSVFTLIIEWDARSIWFYQARLIVEGAGPRELLGSEWSFSHPNYPKLLPLAGAAIAQLAGFWNEALPKLAVPMLLSVPLAYLAGAWRSFLCRVLIFGFIFLICGKYLWNGYADAILAVTAVAALVAGQRYLDRRALLDGYAFALMSALLPALKTEGLLVLGGLYLGLAARVLATGEWRRLLQVIRPIGLPAICALAISLGWFLAIALSATGVANMLQGDAVTRLWERIGDGHSLGDIWAAMFLGDLRWAWAAAGLVLLGVGNTTVRRNLFPYIVAAMVVILGLTILYLMTANDLSWQLRTSVHRTMLAPILLLAVGLVPSTEARHILAQRVPSRADRT